MTQIDYNLRPAKHIERIMLAQAFRRLAHFGAVESYRYVGFGAAYYRDFILFHRDLGITDMISIEWDEKNKERYEFNVPFSCITTLFGHSNEVVPILEWDVRTILWLDYTGKLERYMLADVGYFAANCIPGSVLIVTVNVQADKLHNNPLDKLIQRVGRENLSPDLSDNDLVGWGLSTVSRRILFNKVDEVLVERNGSRTPGARLCFHPLFNFEYADNAKMLSFGGLFCEEGQRGLASACDFDGLHFIRQDMEPFRIEIPLLTFREIHHLQSQLPGNGAPLKRAGIPEAEVNRFREVYRYFPAFSPTDL